MIDQKTPDEIRDDFARDNPDIVDKIFDKIMLDGLLSLRNDKSKGDGINNIADALIQRMLKKRTNK